MGHRSGPLLPILAKLGEMNVPDDKIAERLDAAVEERLAQAAKPVQIEAPNMADPAGESKSEARF
jgi:hypothetical protein